MSGVLCVMTPGEVVMLLWCVDNWDTQLKVREFLCWIFYLIVTSQSVNLAIFSSAPTSLANIIMSYSDFQSCGFFTSSPFLI